MVKSCAKIIYYWGAFKNNEKGASHFLEIAGGLILVAGIVSMAIPTMTTAIKDVISKAITQITGSF